MFSPYLGKEYTVKDIEESIQKFSNRIDVEFCENVYGKAALSIFQGKIIGWYQGRAECGPRALGNRSILADPRDRKMKDKINACVKYREMFRPFAPSVLWEYQSEYFDLDIPSPYMLMVSDIKKSKRHLIPAVTHVDGTGRLQTVIKELNPKFYHLISEFRNMSGIPIVLNTSFNVRGEPIVETPSDAIRCFLNTGIDVLFIGDFCIEKR